MMANNYQSLMIIFSYLSIYSIIALQIFATSTPHQVLVTYDNSKPSDSQEVLIEDNQASQNGCDKSEHQIETHLPQMMDHDHRAIDELSDLCEMITKNMASKLDKILPMLKHTLEEMMMNQDNDYQQQKMHQDLSTGQHLNQQMGKTSYEFVDKNSNEIKVLDDNSGKGSLKSKIQWHQKTSDVPMSNNLAAQNLDYTVKQVNLDKHVQLNKQSDLNEMVNQELSEYQVPVTMYFDDLSQIESPKEIGQAIEATQSPKSALDKSSRITASRASRVRESFGNAAHIARESSRLEHLTSGTSSSSSTTKPGMRSVFGHGIFRGSGSTPTTTTTTSTTTTIATNKEDSTFGEASNRDSAAISIRGWQIDPNQASSNNLTATNLMALEAKFLGYGQLRRNEPINGRVQARLSCQFGDLEMKNMTIKNVEWVRIEGQFNEEKREPPPFDCSEGNACTKTQIKTDLTTTVHPRPAIQNYNNVMAPSYSITLHDIQPDQLGLYRCSAQREVDGRLELVFRLIPLE